MLKMGGAGICASDLHIMQHYDQTNPLLKTVKLPMTLGHENAGWIEARGHGVDGWEIGQPVVAAAPGCGRCSYCMRGLTTYCESMSPMPGIGLDGGLAEYMVSKASALIPLDTLEPWQAAPLTDAGHTSYHAVMHALPLLTPGNTAVVIGIGGLGHLAVAILKAISPVNVIAVNRSPKPLELARERGADLCLAIDENTIEAIFDYTKGQGAIAVFDFVGNNPTMQLAAKVARPLGKIVIPGLGGGSMEFKEGALPYGCSITITMGGSFNDMMDVVALGEAGKIETHIERYSLDEVETAMDRLKNRKIMGRAVMIAHES